MYRPATTQVLTEIERIMAADGMSWNAAVHMLVVKGLRLRELEHQAVARNAGKGYAA